MTNYAVILAAGKNCSHEIRFTKGLAQGGRNFYARARFRSVSAIEPERLLLLSGTRQTGQVRS